MTGIPSATMFSLSRLDRIQRVVIGGAAALFATVAAMTIYHRPSAPAPAPANVNATVYGALPDMSAVKLSAPFVAPAVQLPPEFLSPQPMLPPEAVTVTEAPAIVAPPAAKPSTAAVKAQPAKAKPAIPEKPTEKPAEKSTPAKPASPADARPLSYAAPEKAEPQSPAIGNPFAALGNWLSSAGRSQAPQNVNLSAPLDPNASKTIVYHVKRAQLEIGGHVYEAGSGSREGYNNPAYQGVNRIGPVPVGEHGIVPREADFWGEPAWRVTNTANRVGILFHSARIGLRGRPEGETAGCIGIKASEYPQFVADMKYLKPNKLIVLAN